MSEKILKVKCPSCQEEFKYYSSKFRPFCTERCKMIDMGHWFEESYTIQGKSNTVYIEDPELLQKLVSEETDENY